MVKKKTKQLTEKDVFNKETLKYYKFLFKAMDYIRVHGKIN